MAHRAEASTTMRTELTDKVRTLTKNHDELTVLVNGATFRRFDVDTQEKLLELHRRLDLQMRAISEQVDALDRQVADVFLSLSM
jgi:hypothetical protein